MRKSTADMSFERDDHQEFKVTKGQYHKAVLTHKKNDSYLKEMKNRKTTPKKISDPLANDSFLQSMNDNKTSSENPKNSLANNPVKTKKNLKVMLQSENETDSNDDEDDDVKKLEPVCKKQKTENEKDIKSFKKKVSTTKIVRQSRRLLEKTVYYNEESDNESNANSSVSALQFQEAPEFHDNYSKLEKFKKEYDEKISEFEDIDPSTLTKHYVKINSYTDKMVLLEKQLEVRMKYRKKYPKLPISPYYDELKEQIEPHMELVSKILESKADSVYYLTAKALSQASKRPTISEGDIKTQLMTHPESITAGFYGLKRQFQVGEWIIERFQSQICRRYNNPVIKWWGYEDFALYILSCEVLTSLLNEQMRLRSIKKAYEIMEDTVEYGNFVTDNEPFHSWELDIEKEKIKELDLDEKFQSTFYRKEKN